MLAPPNDNLPPHKGYLFIAMVSYRDEVDSRVRDAIETTQVSLSMQGWLSAKAQFGSADLCDARNVLVSHFHANPDYTHALLVDADVSWEPGTVERLLSYPVDFVLGAYPRRAEDQGFAVNTIPGPVQLIEPLTGNPNPKGIAKINGGPGGLMRLSRNVMDKLIEAHPDRWYHQPMVKPTEKAWNFFEFIIDMDRHARIGEDMNFCRLWRDTGGEVWVDPHLMLHHHGYKTYSGRFLDYLREIGRLDEPAALVKMPLSVAPDWDDKKKSN